MSGPTRRFDPSELQVPGEPAPSVAEQADALLAARELEALVAASDVSPSDGFEARIMAVIATEPAPRLVVRPASSVRGGRIAAFFLAVRDSWGVATTGGRPMMVRAQAMAFVLLVVVATGALASAGAMGVGGLLDRDRTPGPSVQPGPTVAPVRSVMPTPSAEPSTIESAEPSQSPGETESVEPTESTEATDGGETPDPRETDRAETPRPARTPRETETPEPDQATNPGETPKASDDHGGSGG